LPTVVDDESAWLVRAYIDSQITCYYTNFSGLYKKCRKAPIPASFLIFFKRKKGIKLPLAAKVAAVRGGAPGKASGIPRWNVPPHYNGSWRETGRINKAAGSSCLVFRALRLVQPQHLDISATVLIP